MTAVEPRLTGLVAAVCGLALSLTAGAVTASADPDLGPVINTTCNYSQVLAALNALHPNLLRNCPHHRRNGPHCAVSSPRRRMSAGRSSRNFSTIQRLSSTLDVSWRSRTPATTSEPTPYRAGRPALAASR